MNLPRGRGWWEARAAWPPRPPVKDRRRLWVAALAGPGLYRSERLFSISCTVYFSVPDPGSVAFFGGIRDW
jgi:hypothetical protein